MSQVTSVLKMELTLLTLEPLLPVLQPLNAERLTELNLSSVKKPGTAFMALPGFFMGLCA